MGVGLGSLIDLNRKLQNNKNLLKSKKAKERLVKRSRSINVKKDSTKEKYRVVSDVELIEIKAKIKEQIRKERIKGFISTIIKVSIIIGVILILLYLI